MKTIQQELYAAMQEIVSRCWLDPDGHGLPPAYKTVLVAYRLSGALADGCESEADAENHRILAFVTADGEWSFPEFQGDEDSIIVRLWMPLPRPAMRVDTALNGGKSLAEARERTEQDEEDRDDYIALTKEDAASLMARTQKLLALELARREEIIKQGKLIDRVIANVQEREKRIADLQTRAASAEVALADTTVAAQRYSRRVAELESICESQSDRIAELEARVERLRNDSNEH